jgi:hypothetical protein
MDSRSEGQTKIIQVLNNNQVQDYEQMIEAMLEFDSNFGNENKKV